MLIVLMDSIDFDPEFIQKYDAKASAHDDT